MMNNPYATRQNVFITDPSGRLAPSGMSEFNFPYTPTVTSIASSNYSSYDLTHSNFQQRAFDMASNAELTIAAPIVIENEEQARHVMKGMNFFRGSMKMNFGKNDPNKGLPPPVLRFTAHGVYTNVPVLVRDFTYNLDADVDYIEVDDFRLPVISNFVMSLTTTYSPKSVREKFTLDRYLSGSLKGDGYV